MNSKNSKKIKLTSSKGQHTINLTKYQWLKQAKQIGLLFQSASNVTIGYKTYSEGQEIIPITNPNEPYIITHIEDNKLSLISSNDEEKQITLDSNNLPIDSFGQDLFNVHPRSISSKIKNDIKRALNTNITLTAARTFDYKGHKVTIDLDKEEDNIKKWFYVTTPSGVEIDANISPYAPDDTIILWIDAGCPTETPKDRSSWDKESLINLIQSNDDWYKDTFGNKENQQTLATIIKQRLIKQQENVNHVEPPSENNKSNVFCAWCKKEIGFNKHLKGISHGCCKDCAKQIAIDENLALAKNKEKLEKLSQNQVNMGAETNQGMQATPNQLTNQQSQQVQQTLEKLDQPMSMEQWKKSVPTSVKRALQLTPQQMAQKMGEGLNFIKDPKSKMTMERFIEECAKDPAKAQANFRSIINRIHTVLQQENSLAKKEQQQQQMQSQNPPLPTMIQTVKPTIQ